MSPQLPKRPQSGFTLIEASLGLGAAAVLGLAALGLYRSSDATAKVRLEQAHISALAQAIESSLGIVGSFASVSVERVVEDQLVPATLLRGSTLRNAWGGPVDVAPYAFSQPNDSFAVVYGSLPAKACSDLGSALGNQVADLKVNGQSTLQDGGVDPALLAQRCSNGGTMLFVFHIGLASGTAVAVTPVTNPPPVVAPPSAPPSPPGTTVAPPEAPPVVVTPPVIVAPPGVTPPPCTLNPAAPGCAVAPLATTPTPLAPVAIPAGPPTTTPLNAETCLARLALTTDVVSTRNTTSCPSGQYGVVLDQQTNFWFCPDYYGEPFAPATPATPTTYEPWAFPKERLTPWTQVSTTCAPCPAPQSETVAQWVDSSALCPSGQVGSIDWEKAQSQTRSNTVQCGTPTPAGPSAGMSVSPWSAWSTWMDTGATRNLVDTCTPSTCSGPSTDTRFDPRTGGCPSGQTGGTSWDAEQSTSRTCNSGTWSGWGAWSDTGVTSGHASTCAPTSTPMCASNPVLYVGLENGGNGVASIDYSLTGAPSGGSSFVCYERDGCNPAVVLAPAMDIFSWGAACSAGDTYDTVDIPFGYTTTDWMNTYTNHYSCVTVASGTCFSGTPAPAPCAAPVVPETQAQWQPGSAACPPGYSGTHTWEYAESRSRSAFCPASTGAFSWGTWSGWSATGATRNELNSCIAAPTCTSGAMEVQPNATTLTIGNPTCTWGTTPAPMGSGAVLGTTPGSLIRSCTPSGQWSTWRNGSQTGAPTWTFNGCGSNTSYNCFGAGYEYRDNGVVSMTCPSGGTYSYTSRQIRVRLCLDLGRGWGNNWDSWSAWTDLTPSQADYTVNCL